jgi:hypothetical protein
VSGTLQGKKGFKTIRLFIGDELIKSQSTLSFAQNYGMQLGISKEEYQFKKSEDSFLKLLKAAI